MLKDFNKLNIYVKLVIGIVIIIVIAIAIQRISIWAKMQSSQFQLNQEQAVYEAQGLKLTYPPTQYNTYADTLENSDGTWNDDEEAIYTVFRSMRNDLDVLELEKKYRASHGRSIADFLTDVFYRYEIEEVNAILAGNSIVRNY